MFGSGDQRIRVVSSHFQTFPRSAEKFRVVMSDISKESRRRREWGYVQGRRWSIDADWSSQHVWTSEVRGAEETGVMK